MQSTGDIAAFRIGRCVPNKLKEREALPSNLRLQEPSYLGNEQQISLTDLAAAVKAEEKAPKTKKSRAAKPKKPSIRAQLDAAKKEQSKQPPPREKTKELEV